MTSRPTAFEGLSVALGDRYSLERELGRGGMATVYLAKDLRLHRQVALKVLRPELAATLGNDRFLREIEIAARLSHPHILALHDSGEAGGHLYYAMPYVEGESLRQRLEREGQLPIAEVIAIVGAVASALTYAHQQGVIHRDIKPENILLAKDASGGAMHPLVADFGIARALDVAGGERLTETGLALGTPAYMSPEQAAAEARLDGRSDIYALGCVAYEMLAGAPPFSGPTAEVILARHAMDPVPRLHTVRATVSHSLERAIERALAKKPDDRFATADHFADALAAKDSPLPLFWRHLRTQRVRLAAGILAAIGVAAVGSLLTRGNSSPAVIRSAASIAVLPFVSTSQDTLLTRLGRDLAATIGTSLDGVGGITTADRLRVANETADRQDLSPAEGAALARRLGASSFIRGKLLPTGDNVRLQLGLYRSEDIAPIADGISVIAHRDSIRALTDSTTWILLRQIWRRGESPSPSLAAVTTHSLPALRAFLEGERELSANRWDKAALAYGSAVAADSTFWLAHFNYTFTRWWSGEPFGPEAYEALRLHRHALPEREQLLITPMIDSMPLRSRIERYRAVTQRFPDYWPGWFLYADALHHYGPMLGYDWSEALNAFHVVLALNSKLEPAWEHLFWHTNGKDQVEAARTFSRLKESGWPLADDQLLRLQLGVRRAGGVIPPDLNVLADSLAELMQTPSTYVTKHGPPGLPLLLAGFPAAQLELNNRALALDPPRIKPTLRAASAWSWAARGQWDSALTIMKEVASERPGVIGVNRFSPPQFPPIGGPVLPIESYGMAVVSAWLGATAPALADERRAAALAAIDILADDESKRDARARVAWFDGILGYTRRDRRAVQAARGDAVKSRYYQAKLVDRSLAAFDLALAGDRKRAGRDLAALEKHCANANQSHSFLPETHSCNQFTPYIAIQRLAAAQWLQEAGEIEHAARLLRWRDAPPFGGWGGWPWVFSEALAGPTYLTRARLEEIRGDSAKAQAYYEQFLQWYDHPMPALAHLVEEAKAARDRLANRNDPTPAK